MKKQFILLVGFGVVINSIQCADIDSFQKNRITSQVSKYNSFAQQYTLVDNNMVHIYQGLNDDISKDGISVYLQKQQVSLDIYDELIKKCVKDNNFINTFKQFAEKKTDSEKKEFFDTAFFLACDYLAEHGGITYPPIFDENKQLKPVHERAKEFLTANKEVDIKKVTPYVLAAFLFDADLVQVINKILS